MTSANFELLRGAGAVADNPADAATVARLLGVPGMDRHEHTEVFMLNCPPYASVFLDPDGALGGEGTDRVAGFWRAIGLTPPAEPDHLTALLSLYASLGEAAAHVRRPATAAMLARASAALFWEHLWPWLPAYLDAVTDLAIPAASAWAALTGAAITAEAARHRAPAALSLAQRTAPATVLTADPDGLVTVLLIPVRSGIILTRRRLAAAASDTATGYRIGERQYALHAMLAQDPAATQRWLSQESAKWAVRHATRADPGPASRWWGHRAGSTARVLTELAGRAADGVRNAARVTL
jgi:Nitrate reductase delta subunit